MTGERLEIRTLRYMQRASKPLFGGPLHRGIPPSDYPSPIPQLVRNLWIEATDEGFVVTERGRIMARLHGD